MKNGTLLVYVCCAICRWNFIDCLFPMMCEHNSPGVRLTESRQWLARVIPHPESAFYTLCVASCIHPRVFYTAARCLVGLTIGWIGVDYREQYFKIKAIVTTREPPHHQSDGFAITGPTNDGQWATVAYYKGPTLQLALYENEEGLARMKVMTQVIASDEGEIRTAELDVIVDHTMVNKRFDVRSRYRGTYLQWGFHPCTDKEMEQALPKCNEYIKVTGAPLVFYNQSTSQEMVIGVSTWSDCSSCKANYPVVFSYIRGNEEHDLECARMIADDEEENPPMGYYDTLCRAELTMPLNGWIYEPE